MNAGALSLRDLEYVVAVAEERHFGRAAERCNVSQPSLSAQIRKLEENLGLVLFERTSRRVLPTLDGEALLREARAVLGAAQRFLDIATERQGGLAAERLALGAIQTLGPYLFPRILRRLRETFPRLALTLSEGRTAELLDGLREGRLDAALVSPPLDETGLTLAPLFVEPFLLCCPADHALATAKRLRPSDLAGPGLLLLDEGNCLRDQAVAACAAAPNASRHATSLETLRSMVAAGQGYTLLPGIAAADGRSDGALVTCRAFAEDAPGRTVALAWRASDPGGDRLAALARFLRDAAPEGIVAVA